jgi:hypothetical protein
MCLPSVGIKPIALSKNKTKPMMMVKIVNALEFAKEPIIFSLAVNLIKGIKAKGN